MPLHETAPYRIEEVVLQAEDGFRLQATQFGPDEVKGSVVILGATGAPASYYARFASFLAARGHRVLTFDYRGIGRSRPASLRGFRATMSDWALLDARAALEHARHSAPDSALAIVGHSFGGQLVGLLDDARYARAAVFVGAQLGYVGHWDGMYRARLAALWRILVPTLTRICGYLPGSAGVGTDLPAGVAQQWARWCRHPEYLIGEYPDARERFRRFTVPTLHFTANDDDIAPERAVRALLGCLPAATTSRRVVDPSEFHRSPIGHFGFFRPQFVGLWDEAESFIERAFDGVAEVPRSTVSNTRPLESGIDFSEILADLDFGRA